jgi:hypothetical protein
MSGPRFVTINGQRVAWIEIVRLRKEQRDQVKAKQLTLFELKQDARPATERSAAGRYLEPSLFSLLED